MHLVFGYKNYKNYTTIQIVRKRKWSSDLLHEIRITYLTQVQ